MDSLTDSHPKGRIQYWSSYHGDNGVKDNASGWYVSSLSIDWNQSITLTCKSLPFLMYVDTSYISIQKMIYILGGFSPIVWNIKNVCVCSHMYIIWSNKVFCLRVYMLCSEDYCLSTFFFLECTWAQLQNIEICINIVGETALIIRHCSPGGFVFFFLDNRRINIDKWKDTLKEKGEPANINKFTDHLQSIHSIPNTVIVDCTASADVAKHYYWWIKRGIHLITPNKKANSGPLDQVVYWDGGEAFRELLFILVLWIQFIQQMWDVCLTLICFTFAWSI